MARLSLAALLSAGTLLVLQACAQKFGSWKLATSPVDGLDKLFQADGAAVQGAGQAASQGTDTAALVLDEAYAALAVMQNAYFEPSSGAWPTSIEWTGAVIETVVAGMLITMTQALAHNDAQQRENLIASIYAQVVHSYFGQNATDIQTQAFDDILWVVLGWLEAVKFVRLHADLHFPGTVHDCGHLPGQLGDALNTTSWQGHAFMCTFADRARAFWDLASAGWDTKLCHGGMVWNPRLEPYKNAVTNELWIAASASMYQYFPNDTFAPSFAASKGYPAGDPVYLAAAVEGYRWLRNSNMTNSQGLYVDGFHINKRQSGNVECDVRDEMVYTYNQGIVLTGQRGLWSVTGSASYLQEGHDLIRSVIRATGWDLARGGPVDSIDKLPAGALPPWRGLGRGGVLEDKCDVSATCSQDGQTFKGIFFHHLTAFCAPVAPTAAATSARMAAKHDADCRAYLGWIGHNVGAALKTRDATGKFGMWWGAGVFNSPAEAATVSGTEATPNGLARVATNSTDYRNEGTPLDEVWGTQASWTPGGKPAAAAAAATGYQALEVRPNAEYRAAARMARRSGDPNARGRGRTVETQAGAIALLRAYYELSQS